MSKLLGSKIRILILFLTIIITYKSSGQASNKLTLRDSLCHKWKLTSVEVNGKLQPLNGNQKNSFLVFSKNSSYQNISSGGVENGQWQYNETKKEIIINDLKKENDLLSLKILSISKSNCILLMKQKEGIEVKLFFETNEF